MEVWGAEEWSATTWEAEEWTAQVWGTSSSTATVTLTVYMPGSDVVPEDDLFHGRRALMGGMLSRCWPASFIQNGTRYVLSFQHNGSRSDPVVWAAHLLAGATHAFVDLGAVSRTPTEVATLYAAQATTTGITGVSVGGTDSEGRVAVVITGVEAGSLIEPPAVDTRDTALRGMEGGQRDEWGTTTTGNNDGGTGDTGTQHIDNPAAREGRDGRVLGMYMWGHGGYAPRLMVSRGPAYSTNPGALTVINQAEVVSGLNGYGTARFLDPSAILTTDELWNSWREDTAGGTRFRFHGESPVGQGDIGLNQFTLADTTSPTSSGTAFGATYTPVVGSSFPIYMMVGIIYEIPDASGNYFADGNFRTWIGDQNTDVTHGTQTPAPPAVLDIETTHHRFRIPQWRRFAAVGERIGVAAAQTSGVNAEFVGCCFYEFPNLNVPSVATIPLLGAPGSIAITAANAMNSLVFTTPVQLGYGDIGADLIVGMGNNYTTADGSALSTLTIPVFLDAFAGDGGFTTCWESEGRTWHDAIQGASGGPGGVLRAPISGEEEYRSTDGSMPTTSPASVWPDPFNTDPSNDSPIAIADYAYEAEAPGFAAQAA